jgi:DNA-binding NtrC family response regulator
MALRLLIIHPDDAFRHHLSERMRQENYSVAETAPEADAMAILRKCSFDVILLKVTGQYPERLSMLNSIRDKCPKTKVILLTSHDEHTLHGSIQAMRMGAFDELTVPLDIGELQNRIRDAYKQKKCPNPKEAEQQSMAKPLPKGLE